MTDYEIVYYRGDKYPKVITLRDGSQVSKPPLNITGYSFKMSLDTREKPDDETTQVWQIDATLDADPTTGKAYFAITDVETDITPATYYYDIQMTTPSGDIRTIAKGIFKITMDITK